MKLNNPKPFDKAFMLGLYTGHVFFNPKTEQYPFCLHLYDNTQDKVVYVGYFSNPTQLGNQVYTYILDKYTENNIDYDNDFLSISIDSMVDTLDMLCYDKTTEDEVIIQSNMFGDLEI
jgi:hypothetical protein